MAKQTNSSAHDPRDWSASLEKDMLDAQKCVNKFEAETLEDTMIVNQSELADWDDPPPPPRKFTQVPAQSLKPFFVRISLLAIIGISLYFLGEWVFSNKTAAYEDSLVSLSPDRDDYQSVETYVRYIVGKFRGRGLDEIESKWVEVPPEFKRQAKDKLTLLADSTFKIASVSVDKVSTYDVECAPFDSPRSIFIQVVRQKSGKNTIYRLQRIY